MKIFSVGRTSIVRRLSALNSVDGHSLFRTGLPYHTSPRTLGPRSCRGGVPMHSTSESPPLPVRLVSRCQEQCVNQNVQAASFVVVSTAKDLGIFTITFIARLIAVLRKLQTVRVPLTTCMQPHAAASLVWVVCRVLLYHILPVYGYHIASTNN